MYQKAVFLYLLSLFFVLTSFAQVQTDSLYRALKYASGKDRISTLNALATLIRESDQLATITMSLEADSLATVQGDHSARSRALENIGWSYYRLGNWQKSFEFSSQAFELALEVVDKKQAARLMNNLGALSYQQRNHQKSIKQFKIGYHYATEVNDIQTRIRSLNNIALNFTETGQQDSAIYYAQKSIQLNNAEAGTPYFTSFIHRLMGDVYLAKGQYDSAQAIYRRSLSMARTLGIKSFEAGVLHRLGNAYFLDKKLSQAKEILEHSIEHCKENGYLDELSKSHKYLANVYENQGDIIKAFVNLKAHQFLNDSLLTKSNKNGLALIRGVFEENLQHFEVEILKAQNEYQALKLHSSKRYLIFFSLGIALFLGLLIWMISLNRKIQEKNRGLESQKNQIAEKNKILAEQSAQLLEINETKNKLFSVLGHDLRGPIGKIKSLVDLLAKGHLDQEEFLELIHALQCDINSVNFTLDNILNWSISQLNGFNESPVEIELKHIVEDSLNFLGPFFKEKKLTVLNQIPDNQSIYADRGLVDVVVRNVLNNAMKFSNSGGVITIFSKKNEGWVKLCVCDQGIGMSPIQIEKLFTDSYSIAKSMPGTQKEKGSGLGLQLVKEFVRKVGGKIELESDPNRGTKFCIKFPSKDPKQAYAVL